MKAQTYPFKNSATCEGIAYVDSEAPLDIATIEISGRYPEKGWAKNDIVHEVVYIQRGMGTLALRNGESTELHEGDAIHVSPGEWFAWSGNMILTMACHPPFTQEQYTVEESEDEI